uniref:hypothetical protein n=1 Tax=Paenibacillus thermotolerans TaxID=3027807 RepID=UPI002368A106
DTFEKSVLVVQFSRSKLVFDLSAGRLDYHRRSCICNRKLLPAASAAVSFAVNRSRGDKQ